MMFVMKVVMRMRRRSRKHRYKGCYDNDCEAASLKHMSNATNECDGDDDDDKEKVHQACKRQLRG